MALPHRCAMLLQPPCRPSASAPGSGMIAFVGFGAKHPLEHRDLIFKPGVARGRDGRQCLIERRGPFFGGTGQGPIGAQGLARGATSPSGVERDNLAGHGG